MYASQQNVPICHCRCSSLLCLSCCNQSQKGIGCGSCYIELTPLRGSIRLVSRTASSHYVGVRSPKSKGCQLISSPVALPHTEPPLLLPITGPEIEGRVLCGSVEPKTLLRVARLTCTSPSTRGR